MAKRKQQDDMISRLAHTGEEALHKLAELPGGAKFLEAANALRDRVDELAVRIRSLDPLEKRVTELERRLDELSKPASRSRSATARRPAARRTGGRSTATRPRKTSG
jgi:hypothetical protein